MHRIRTIIACPNNNILDTDVLSYSAVYNEINNNFKLVKMMMITDVLTSKVEHIIYLTILIKYTCWINSLKSVHIGISYLV